MLARRTGPEEVERLLDFQHDDLGHLLQDGRFCIFTHCPHLVPQLKGLSIVEAQVQLLLQRVRVLMTAHAYVARKQRRRAFHDVDVHHTRAQVQERHHLARRRLVVVLVAVLQRQGIDVDNSRASSGHREYVGVVQNLVLLDCHQQYIHLRAAHFFGQNLVVQADVGQIERNV